MSEQLVSLELKDFKSFRHATIELEPFNLLVGTNAAGKSNVRDALRFLHGFARGYSVAEVLGGRYQDGVSVWSGIRGGAREICRSGTHKFSLSLSIGRSLKGKEQTARRITETYEISIEIPRKSGAPPRIVHESLSRPTWGKLFETRKPRTAGQDVVKAELISGGNYKRCQVVDMSRSSCGLTKVDDWLREAGRSDLNAAFLRSSAQSILNVLRGLRFMDISPDAARQPSIPGANELGERGENLSSVIQHLVSDTDRANALASWLRHLTPMDVKDFDFLPDATGRVLLELREEDGTRISANSASDGTIRFLVLLAALSHAEGGHTFFLEEIDNGLHPARLDLLMRLIEQQTRSNDIMVIATTHSPPLLRLLAPDKLHQGFVCWRPEDSNESRITRVSDIQSLGQALNQSDLAQLHESSWFQDTLEFEDREDEEA